MKLGIKVLRAVVVKSSIFWDITPFSPLKVKGRFGGTWRRYIPPKRQHEAGSK
jgi:hypothetical protein